MWLEAGFFGCNVAKANHRKCDAANLFDVEKRQVFNDVVQREPFVHKRADDSVRHLSEVIEIIGVLL